MKKKKTIKPPSIGNMELPECVALFVDSAPDDFKLAVLLSVLCCYCTLGTRLRVKYVYDLDLHALLLQVLIVGEPGAGKSFTRGIVKRLMGALRLRDKEERNKEKAYRKMVKMFKNKSLPDEPLVEVRCMQTITRAMLTKRADAIQTKYGEPLSFFLFAEEMSLMADSNKRTYADLRTLDRLAYDLGSEFCNETMYDAGCNSDVDICWNSLFCGTENSLNEYVDKRSVERGKETRKVPCKLRDMLGDDAPKFKPIDSSGSAVIKNMVERLMNETYAEDGTLQPTHEIPMQWLDQHVEKWCQEQRLEVLKTGSRARNCFYKRSSLSAFRMAAMLYYLWGEDESKQKQVAKFYQFMATYTLEGLLAQWGLEYEKMHEADKDELAEQKASIYDLCPNQFTRDQLRELLIKLKHKTDARNFICKWKRAKLIHEVKDSKTELFEKNYKA